MGKLRESDDIKSKKSDIATVEMCPLTHRCIHGEALGGRQRWWRAASAELTGSPNAWIVPGAACGRGRAPGTSMKCCEQCQKMSFVM